MRGKRMGILGPVSPFCVLFLDFITTKNNYTTLHVFQISESIIQISSKLYYISESISRHASIYLKNLRLTFLVSENVHLSAQCSPPLYRSRSRWPANDIRYLLPGKSGFINKASSKAYHEGIFKLSLKFYSLLLSHFFNSELLKNAFLIFLVPNSHKPHAICSVSEKFRWILPGFRHGAPKLFPEEIRFVIFCSEFFWNTIPGASFSENFYSMKRIVQGSGKMPMELRDRIRCLAILVKYCSLYCYYFSKEGSKSKTHILLKISWFVKFWNLQKLIQVLWPYVHDKLDSFADRWKELLDYRQWAHCVSILLKIS